MSVSAELLADAVDSAKRAVTCSKCSRPRTSTGGCAHRGSWHDSLSACSAKCGWKLGIKRLGQCHWSCCYSTDYDSLCPLEQHAFTAEEADEIEYQVLRQLLEEQTEATALGKASTSPSQPTSVGSTLNNSSEGAAAAEWTCSGCTLLNAATDTQCALCATSRPSAQHRKRQQPPPAVQNHANGANYDATVAVDAALQTSADTVIIGAGPVGLFLAIQLKACCPQMNVVVFEKYKEYQRKHVLNIEAASLRPAVRTEGTSYWCLSLHSVVGE